MLFSPAQTVLTSFSLHRLCICMPVANDVVPLLDGVSPRSGTMPGLSLGLRKSRFPLWNMAGPATINMAARSPLSSPCPGLVQSLLSLCVLLQSLSGGLGVHAWPRLLVLALGPFFSALPGPCPDLVIWVCVSCLASLLARLSPPGSAPPHTHTHTHTHIYIYT